MVPDASPLVRAERTTTRRMRPRALLLRRLRTDSLIDSPLLPCGVVSRNRWLGW